jgi:hypothetical protein
MARINLVFFHLFSLRIATLDQLGHASFPSVKMLFTSTIIRDMSRRFSGGMTWLEVLEAGEVPRVQSHC